ncbi:transposase, partial [Escherichia coli]|nr:transposase [Escherichia coli]
YYKQQQRLKGMRKRAEEKIRDAEDEVVNVLEHKPQEPWLENIYRPVGNTVAVQQPAVDDEPDEEYERNFQRGLQLLEAKLKENDPLA